MDITDLQKEIVRLNKIISVLLEQIDMLKQNDSRFENRSEANDLHSCTPQKEIGLNHPVLSTSPKGSGTNEMDLSSQQKETGINKLIASGSQKGSGTNQPFASNLQKESGTNELLLSNSQKGIPQKQISGSPSEKEIPLMQQHHSSSAEIIPANEPVLSLPEKIDASGHNLSLLESKLYESVMKRSRDSVVENAAIVLIHFYNKGSGKYDELEELTGYSRGGLGKFMILMRRKGLIQRSAFQHFVPSQRALQLMQQANLQGAA